MRGAWFVVVAGCYTSATPANEPQQVQERARAIAPAQPVEPRPPKAPLPANTSTLERYSGRDLVTSHLSRDEVLLIDRRAQLHRIDRDAFATSDLDFLGPCMRDFVKAQPITARTVLLDVIGRYATTCDHGAITLERPLGCNSGERRARNDVSLVGPLAAHGAGLVLRVSSCGTSRTFDRVTLRGGDATWTSSRVELVHDTYGCDVAELPVTRTLANAVRATLEADDPMIAFEGADTELALDDTLRDELRSVLSAIDAISVP